MSKRCWFLLFAAFALSASMAAHAQAPTPRPLRQFDFQPGEQKQQTANNEEPTRNPHTNSHPASSLSNATSLRQQETIKKTAENKQNANNAISWGTVSDWLIVVFTFVLTVVAAFQYRLDRRLAAENSLSVSSARRAADEAEKQTEEAKRQTDAAKAALAVTREMAIAQSRAYLIAEHAQMHTHWQREEISLHIKNIGATPTKWIEIESNAQLVEVPISAKNVPLDFTGNKMRWPTDAGSGGDYLCEPRASDTVANLIKTGMKEKKCLILQGTLRWETVFDEVFESTFFFWGQPRLWQPKGPDTLEEVPQKMGRPPVETPTLVLVKPHPR